MKHEGKVLQHFTLKILLCSKAQNSFKIVISKVRQNLHQHLLFNKSNHRILWLTYSSTSSQNFRMNIPINWKFNMPKLQNVGFSSPSKRWSLVFQHFWKKTYMSYNLCILVKKMGNGLYIYNLFIYLIFFSFQNFQNWKQKTTLYVFSTFFAHKMEFLITFSSFFKFQWFKCFWVGINL